MKTIFKAVVIVAAISANVGAYADYATAKISYDGGQYVEALRELQPLAASDNADAQNLLATMYINGQGVDKNVPEAMLLYKKAAEKGNTDALAYLSDLYANGTDVQKDEVMAAYWKLKATISSEEKAKDSLFYALRKAARQDGKNTVQTGDSSIRAIRKHLPFGNDCRPSYPPESVKANQSGTVTVQLMLDIDGNVIDALIARSSGWPMLDLETVVGLKECKFKPSTINGVPVPSLTRLDYVWKIAD